MEPYHEHTKPRCSVRLLTKCHLGIHFSASPWSTQCVYSRQTMWIYDTWTCSNIIADMSDSFDWAPQEAAKWIYHCPRPHTEMSMSTADRPRNDQHLSRKVIVNIRRPSVIRRRWHCPWTSSPNFRKRFGNRPQYLFVLIKHNSFLFNVIIYGETPTQSTPDRYGGGAGRIYWIDKSIFPFPFHVCKLTLESSVISLYLWIFLFGGIKDD